MESHFFNDKNVNNMTNILIKQLNIKNDPEIKKKCKKLVHQQMKDVYDKYGSKRPEGMKSAEFLNALNRKSVKQSIVICESSKKKKQTKESSVSDLKLERDALTFGPRNLKQPPKRPEHTSRVSEDKEMMFNDTTNMSNFASFDTKSPAQYVRADGSLSRDAPTDWDDNVNVGRSKQDDLERAMNERQKDYNQNNRASNVRGGKTNEYRDDRQMFNNNNNNNYNDEHFSGGFNDNDNNYNNNYGNFDGNDDYEDNFSGGNDNFSGGDGSGGRNDRNYNDDTAIKSRYNDALASRNNLDTDSRKPPPKNFNPSISPYQNGNNKRQKNDYDDERDDDRKQRNDGDRRQRDDGDRRQRDDGGDRRQRNNNNDDRRQRYDDRQQRNNQNQNQNQNDNSNHLNGSREVSLPLYNNNNFIKEEMINLDSEQLDAYISKMKSKISTQINLSNFDPNCLQNLSSSELKELINKISLDLSGINNIINDPSPSPSTFHINNNHDNYNHDISPREQDNTLTSKQHDNKNKCVDILIKSNEWDQPENYNDYMVDFKEPYTHVTSFQLLNLKLPALTNVINTDNNNMKILLNDDEINKNITPNMYELQGLLNIMNMYLAPSFNVSHNNGRVTITNITNIKFDMANGEKSVFKLLGFKKSNYIDKVSYVGEEEPLFGSNRDVYLFIEGIKDEEAIFKFKSMENPNNLCPVTLTLDKPIEELSEIFIKFKYEDNVESNKNVNFHGKPHELLVRLGQ